MHRIRRTRHPCALPLADGVGAWSPGRRGHVSVNCAQVWDERGAASRHRVNSERSQMASGMSRRNAPVLTCIIEALVDEVVIVELKGDTIYKVGAPRPRNAPAPAALGARSHPRRRHPP